MHNQRYRYSFWLGLALIVSGCSNSSVVKDEATVQQVDSQFQSADEALEAGDRARATGRAEMALAAYLAGLEIENTSALWSRVGSIHADIGNNDTAIEAFRRSIAADPDDADGQLGLGLAYLDADRRDEARLHLVRSLELDGRDWQADNALGILEDKEGRHESAVRHFEAALRKMPGHPAILTNVGYSHYLQGDFDEAARFYYQAATTDAGYTPAQVSLGLLYARIGWYTDALETLLDVQDPATAYNDIGYISMANGDFEVARDYLTEATRRSPTYFEKAARNLEILDLKERQRVRSLHVDTQAP